MRRSKLVLLALALLAIGSAAGSAHADGAATLGTQWWSQSAPEAKFQEFRQVPQGAFLESFLVRGGSDRWKTAFWGSNALHNDQQMGLAVSHGVRWQLNGRWQEIPHNISQVARLGYTQIAPGVFVLPDSLQSRNQANPGGYRNRITDYLNGAAGGTPLGFRTDVGNARLRVRPSQDWKLEFAGERRNRSGEKPYGATFGFSNAVEMVEPINQQMWRGDATASYQRGRLGMRFSGGYSEFDNHVNALRWDNPTELTDVSGNPGQGLLDLYPNNKVLRGSAGFVARLPHASTFTASFGASRITQNDPWLPFTVNSAIPQASLDLLYTSPARSTDAKAMRMNVDSRLAGRIASKLHGALRYNQSHYDNQTPVHAFRGFVPYDNAIDPASAVADSLIRTEPFGTDMKTIGADLDYALTDRVQLEGTAEHRIHANTLREIETDKEEYFRVRGSAEATDDVQVDVSVFQGIRVADAFDALAYFKADNADSVATELAGLRRYDVANRHQRGGSVGVDVSVTDRLDIGGNVTHLRNRYPESVYGLRADETNEFLGEATYKASHKVDLSGGYGVNRTSTDQESNETNAAGPPTPDAATDWRARIHDRNDFAFATVGLTASERVHLALGYTFSRDQANYDLANGTGTAQDLPDTFYRLHVASLEARYKLKGGTEIGARYRFEDYSVVDFASQDIPLVGPPSGAVTALYLGDNSLPYHAHVVSFVATRRF